MMLALELCHRWNDDDVGIFVHCQGFLIPFHHFSVGHNVKKNFVGRRFLFLCVFVTGFITPVSYQLGFRFSAEPEFPASWLKMDAKVMQIGTCCPHHITIKSECVGKTSVRIFQPLINQMRSRQHNNHQLDSSLSSSSRSGQVNNHHGLCPRTGQGICD